MQLSEHFSLEEMTASQTAARLGINNKLFAQPCAGTLLARLRETAERMEGVRTKLDNNSIHVDSGYRCLALNRALHSKDTSAHIQGYAVDFICPQFGDPLEVAHRLRDSLDEWDQIITEGRWVHISFAPAMRRETLTAVFEHGTTTYKAGLDAIS